MTYVDIILPLAIDFVPTYSVPSALEASVVPGRRVVVPFGQRKQYSGVVLRVHDRRPPDDIVVKDILEVIDDAPIVTPQQIKLWQWMAGYYLCTPGEVMIAAMPAGLKLASESVVGFNVEFDGASPLTPTEQKLVDILSDAGDMKIGALERKSGHKNIMARIRSLYDKGAVRMCESLRESYRPRCETRVELAADYLAESRLTEKLDALAHFPKQQRLLETYIELSGAAAAVTLRNANILRPVTKAELLHKSGMSAGVFATLQKKGILTAKSVDISRLRSDGAARIPPHALSASQQNALTGIESAFREKSVCLLHGVTSSGKTEVYIHLIARAIERGESVLFLLPEIALTTQITQRLRLFFGDDMGVFHSKFPDNERVEVWKKQLSERPYKLIVGVRSSLFLPMPRLGLVIVDEEHETSYKQEDPAPRYNARDAAIVLAGMCGAKTLLGTATPSLESYANARAGKYGLVEITERFGAVLLPEIRVEDVKELRRKKMMTGPFSPELLREMREALEAGQQTILFQNRRGYASFLECHACGWVPKCEHCDVSLTYHRASGKLVCHYCGAVYSVPQRCPACENECLDERGSGTEKIEDAVSQIFPQARVARLDLDTTQVRSAYEKILSAFRDGRTDILIGTQMVSKGLDFDRVRVVGVLDADAAMNVPDFRSYERAYQMMSQVAGRAGRRDTRGVVILQTRRPDEALIAQVAANNYTAMFDTQMSEREMFGFPPFCRMIYVYLRHRTMYEADCAARIMAETLRPAFGDNLLGPAAPPVARVKSLFIRQIMLKVPRTAPAAGVRSVLQNAAAHVRKQCNVDIYFDVDPL